MYVDDSIYLSRNLAGGAERDGSASHSYNVGKRRHPAFEASVYGRVA
jgi:hypothetical protein